MPSIKPEEKIIIFKIFKYFESLSDGLSEPIQIGESRNSLMIRISEITGYSRMSILNIIHQAEDVKLKAKKKSLESNLASKYARKKYHRKAQKTGLDEDELNTVRFIVYHFHELESRLPTLKGLRAKILEVLGVELSKSSLSLVLKKLGFKFTKSRNNREQLVENPYIIAKRRNYLQKLAEYRAQGRYVVYLDETYIHTSYTAPLAWSDKTSEGHRKKLNKGDRFVIVHAGGKNGFIPGAFACFRSATKNEDYHGEWNRENFLTWARTQLIPNLPDNSVVVMDNASYHCTRDDNSPNANNRKADIIDWLEGKVDFSREDC